MDKLVYTAATGLRAHMAAQSAIANNMANASTTGFRADRVVFDRIDLKGGGQQFEARAPTSEEVTVRRERSRPRGGRSTSRSPARPHGSRSRRRTAPKPIRGAATWRSRRRACFRPVMVFR
jgi:hypothetical protein